MAALVTAVIPCFNHGRFVAECVASLEAQTVADWRAIVLDDASTDGETPALCDAVASDRVRVVHLPKNHGRALVRNVGIGLAETEAVLSLDADDALEPTHFERTVPLLLSDPRLGIVYTDYRYFGSEQGIMRGRPFSRQTLYVAQYIYAGSLFRRSAWAQTAGYRAEFSEGNEDYDFFLSLVEAGFDGAWVPEPLYRYRKHAGQWSAQRAVALADQILTTRQRLRAFHHEGLAARGLLEAFDHVTWSKDAEARIAAGEPRAARASLRRAARARPFSTTNAVLFFRALAASNKRES